MPISVQAHPLTQQECDTFDKVLREDPQYRWHPRCLQAIAGCLWPTSMASGWLSP